MAERDSEIRQFYVIRRKLDNALPDKKLPFKAWQAELDKLGQEYAVEQMEAKTMWDELKKLRDSRYKMDRILHDRQRSQPQRVHEQER